MAFSNKIIVIIIIITQWLWKPRQGSTQLLGLAVETYGNWGKEARNTINQLASRLSIVSSLHKPRVLFELVPGSVEL